MFVAVTGAEPAVVLLDQPGVGVDQRCSWGMLGDAGCYSYIDGDEVDGDGYS